MAPEDVWIRPGPTGLDPKQTSFFGNLQITTKIVKGQIEITQDKLVITKDTRIDSSQSALLDKLNIKPFSYKMEVRKVLQEGKLFDAAVLDIKAEDIFAKFRSAVSNMTALSLGAEYPTELSAPHSILNAFKNLAAVSFQTDYSFKEAEALKEACANAPAATAAPAAAEEAPAEEEKAEEEEEQVAIGGLFGGDDSEEDY